MTLKTDKIVISMSVDPSSITFNTASFSGTVTGLSPVDRQDIEFGFLYSTDPKRAEKTSIVLTSEIDDDGQFRHTVEGLQSGTKYYYFYYIRQRDSYIYSGESQEFTLKDYEIDLKKPDGTDLSFVSSANCYVVTSAGSYCFKVYKGNSTSFVGIPSTAEVLWESFGTSVTPTVGDLIKSASYSDGYVAFQTADTFKEGNAVIAAKDASGNILWSWHIWLTDEPQGQEYYNNAGVMMDRNLGATSATPGDVGALGLLYQWGRKDPFLGSSSISSSSVAASTITWPSSVQSTETTGTIDYATANPTTFIGYIQGIMSRNDELNSRAEAIEDALTEGIAIGREEERMTVARNLIAMGLSAEQIVEATGLTVENVTALRSS